VPTPVTDDLAPLRAILARLAAQSGETVLLVTAQRPDREYRACLPYGVQASCADRWEKENAAEQILPSPVLKQE
jgi:hypothetical protein